MSTVTIDLTNISGAAVSCQVTFTPLDTPSMGGPALTVSGQLSVMTASDGTGSVTLAPGRYCVTFHGIPGDANTLYISVPYDANTYALTALLWRGAALAINSAGGQALQGLIKIDALGNVTPAAPFVDFVPPSVAGSYRFTAARGFELFNATTGLWNAPTVSGPAGSEASGLNPGEA